MVRDERSRERRIDQAAGEYIERIRLGETVDRDEFIRLHPDLAPDLAEFLDDYQAFGWLKEGDEPSEDPVVTVGQRFDDYEILEEAGRGGMGVVFKARQLSLDRLVALKVVLGGRFASAEDRKRFRREAVAAAQLDHPHISRSTRSAKPKRCRFSRCSSSRVNRSRCRGTV